MVDVPVEFIKIVGSFFSIFLSLIITTKYNNVDKKYQIKKYQIKFHVL